MEKGTWEQWGEMLEWVVRGPLPSPGCPLHDYVTDKMVLRSPGTEHPGKTTHAKGLLI